MTTLTLASVLASAQRRKQKHGYRRLLSQLSSLRGLAGQCLAELQLEAGYRTDTSSQDLPPAGAGDALGFSTIQGRKSNPGVDGNGRAARGLGSRPANCTHAVVDGRRPAGWTQTPALAAAAAPTPASSPIGSSSAARNLGPVSTGPLAGACRNLLEGDAPPSRTQRTSGLAAVLSEGTTFLAFLLFLGGALLI